MGMNKIFVLMFASMLIILGACSNDGVTQEEQSEEVIEDEEQEETMDEEFDKREESIVKTENQVVEKFVDTSIGQEIIGVYAKVTNDRDIPVVVYDVQVTLYDSNDDILSIENDHDLISPSLLNKSDNGYLSLNIDYDDNYEDLDYVEIKYETDEIIESDINELKVTKENILKEDGFSADEDDEERFDSPMSEAIKVMFNIENTYDKELGYSFGIGYYNKDDELIGASSSNYYADEDYLIQANGNKNVEQLEFLPVDYEEVEKVDINVIGTPSEDEY